jgi:hypothetical protein
MSHQITMPYHVGKMDSVIGNSIIANNTTQTKRYILHTTHLKACTFVTPNFEQPKLWTNNAYVSKTL